MSQYSIFNYPCVRVRMLVGVCEIFTKKKIFTIISLGSVCQLLELITEERMALMEI